MSKKKKTGNKKIKKSQVSMHDGVQIVNNKVQDAHHIVPPTLIEDLFGIEIKDDLIDPDTRFYI